MKVKMLKKLYKFNESMNAFILDVQLNDYRDAYSDWDFSPFTNRDLDEDLTEYLLECSQEIPFKYQLVIDFHILTQMKNEARETKSIVGMRNYFRYQLRKMKNQKVRVARDMITFMLIGSILLLLGFYFETFLSESLLLSLLSEGLFVGGWVMLWEMFSTWFFDLKKVNDKCKHFERLSKSKLIYSYGNGG